MFNVLSRALPTLQRTSLSFAAHNFNLARNMWMSNMFQWQSPFMLMAERGKSCLRTNKSAAKRFRVMGNGRIKRNKAGKRHNTGHKGRSRVNRLAASAPITEKSIENRMRRLIGA